MIKFDIKNRWTREVKFTAEIECEEDAPLSVKVGLSVKWGVEHAADLTNADLTAANLTRANLTNADLTAANLTRANLTNADLTDADLTNANLTKADLTRANLTNANLTNANLTNANLTNANLTNAKRDFFAILLTAIGEIGFLRQALIDGKVEGSTYNGECACLVGTIARGRKCSVDDLEKDSSRPAERFFMAIRRGDTPETNAASKIALAWTDEAIALLAPHIKAP